MTKEIALFIYDKESGVALATFYHVINYYEHRNCLVIITLENDTFRISLEKYNYTEVS